MKPYSLAERLSQKPVARETSRKRVVRLQGDPAERVVRIGVQPWFRVHSYARRSPPGVSNQILLGRVGAIAVGRPTCARASDEMRSV